MQKPLFKNLQNDIDALLDHIKTYEFSRDTLQSQIMHVLTETYNALDKLDECRIENEHLGKFENDRTSVQKYIDHYQKLFNQAEEKEDENLKFRHATSVMIYETFLTSTKKALSILRIPIAANSLYEQNEEYRLFYIDFMSKNDPKTLSYTQRNYANRDLFLNLYKRLEGYQITHNKIVKSAGLKIFTFFNFATKVQKTKLATHLGYLFSALEENLSLDPKRAESVKIIGEFQGFILFDYLSNKKSDLYDFGIAEVFNKMLKNFVLMYKKQGDLAMVRRINNNRKKMEVTLLAKLLT